MRKAFNKTEISPITIAKVIEHALSSDHEKVIAYGELIANQYKKNGQFREYKIIMSAVNQEEKQSVVILD